MAPQSTQRHAARLPTRSTPRISQPPTRRRPAGGSGKAAGGCRALRAAIAPAGPVRGLGGGAGCDFEATGLLDPRESSASEGGSSQASRPFFFTTPGQAVSSTRVERLATLAGLFLLSIADVRSTGGVGFPASRASRSFIHFFRLFAWQPISVAACAIDTLTIGPRGESSGGSPFNRRLKSSRSRRSRRYLFPSVTGRGTKSHGEVGSAKDVR